MILASTSFKTEFAVDMTCQSCVGAVKDALQDLPGIERYDIELENKRVTITGKTPPSQLLAALKSTERQVLVRGSGAVDPSLPPQAAISILESPISVPTTVAKALPESTKRELYGLQDDEFTQKVFGIARFVQISPRSILLDLTVRLPPSQNTFRAYVSKTGNLVDPPVTTKGAFVDLGTITPDGEGYGDLFKEVEGELWEWIGRACVVEQEGVQAKKDVPEGTPSFPAGSVFAGVVARSAGTWGNDKTVCACSGRTMWEEGREMEGKAKGML
ncbi:hypothetical protein CspeluHIS016_0209490 [Cutaneotrichosporon spelunceum]|uniref:Superoxide dismutase 1 copper chaperone n=1 Tax=Cutaneotrichosporon spelunceum TaxID=1672016 RepID=A0AAD3TSJ6_9TREE|nr:hypothetical protein CspeluHIS016_0209490 [Cutaneotrichosporon spelunceum]